MTRFAEYRRFLLDLDARASRDEPRVDRKPVGEAPPSAACEALLQSARRHIEGLRSIPRVSLPAELSEGFLESVYARALEHSENGVGHVLQDALRTVPMPKVDIDPTVTDDDGLDGEGLGLALQEGLARPLRMPDDAAEVLLTSLRQELSDSVRFEGRFEGQFEGADPMPSARRRRWVVAAALFLGVVGSGLLSEVFSSSSLFSNQGTTNRVVAVEFVDADQPLDVASSPSHFIRSLGR